MILIFSWKTTPQLRQNASVNAKLQNLSNYEPVQFLDWWPYMQLQLVYIIWKLCIMSKEKLANNFNPVLNKDKPCKLSSQTTSPWSFDFFIVIQFLFLIPSRNSKSWFNKTRCHSYYFLFKFPTVLSIT